MTDELNLANTPGSVVYENELILQLTRAGALRGDESIRSVPAIRMRLIELHENVDIQLVVRSLRAELAG